MISALLFSQYFDERITPFTDISPPSNVESITPISEEITTPVLSDDLTNKIERINHERLPLYGLGLTKGVLIQIAPFLDYVNCMTLFDDNWEDAEIQSFLNACNNAKFLAVNSSRIKALPPLELCETLKIYVCHELGIIPPLPSCKELILVDVRN